MPHPFARRRPERPFRARLKRDHDHVGIDHRGKRFHLPRSADSSLDHRVPVRGLEPAERERDPDLVVQIAFGRQDVRIPSAQKDSQELLGGGLAGAARYPDDGSEKGLPMPGGDGLKGRQRVLDHELGKGDYRIRVGDQCGGGPGLEGRRQVVVAVPAVSLERDKRLALRQPSGVDGKSGGRASRAPRPSAAGPSREKLWIERRHQVLKAFTPINSLTT